MGTWKYWLQAVYKINKTEQGKNKKMEIEQQVKSFLQEAKKLSQDLSCNTELTSVWIFTEEDEIKYMVQSFYGEGTDMCIRGNVEDNWPDAIISFYKNAKAMISAYTTLNSDEYGF